MCEAYTWKGTAFGTQFSVSTTGSRQRSTAEAWSSGKHFYPLSHLEGPSFCSEIGSCVSFRQSLVFLPLSLGINYHTQLGTHF